LDQYGAEVGQGNTSNALDTVGLECQSETSER